MKAAYHVGRIVFGLWFLFSGVEYFLPYDLQPLGEMPLAREFTLALIHSGLMSWIKVAEILIGIFVLINRAMPLTMAATAPITFVIAYWNFVLEPGVVEYVFGIATVALNLFLLWPYRAYWLPMFVWKARPDYGLSLKPAGD
jgi:hypothetical protein